MDQDSFELNFIMCDVPIVTPWAVSSYCRTVDVEVDSRSWKNSTVHIPKSSDWGRELPNTMLGTEAGEEDRGTPQA